MQKTFLLIGVMLGCLSLSNTAQAQTETSGENVFQQGVYPANYFAEYAPRTANDMIAQIPGFNVSERDNSRGLGQGGANVLINGARLTGKTSARDQLGRIASTNVTQIEILDGAALNIPGLSGQVANIITSTSGITGVWNWQPRFRRDHDARLAQGEISISGERQNLAYTLLLGINSRRDGKDGPEFLSDASRTILEDRLITTKEYSENYKIGTDLNWTPRADHVATLSAEYNAFNSNRGETRDSAVLATNIDTQRVFARSEDEWNARIDADYELPFLAGRLKIIGAHRTEISPIYSTVLEYQSDVLGDSSISDLDQDEGETILRSEYSWQSQAGNDLQFSLEGAFNYLENDETQTDLGLASERTLSRVEEKRAETTLTYGRAVTPKLDVQSSIGVEYSELSQTALGATEAFARDFVRPKGFISAAYKYDDSLTIRSRVEREVGQLNFNDFISSVDLQNDFDNSGNPDLVPQQAWLANIELDKKFGPDMNVQAKIYGALVSDTVDRIPVGVDGDAVGNLDDKAIRYGLELSGAGKFDSLGWEGVQAEFALNLRESEVDDPLTGQPRPLSRSQQYYWQLGFRHDVPNTDWAYGSSISQNQFYDNYRVKSIIRTRNTQPRTSIYIEHKDLWGVKVQARVLNVLDESTDVTETSYDLRRDIGVIEEFESNSLKGHLFAQISFSGTF